LLDDNHYEKIGNNAKVNPSLKSKKDCDALWKSMNEGIIDAICSDHAPHTFSEKSGKDYDATPAGFPGVETTVPLMLDAVNEKKVEFTRFIRMMSENPSEIFGIKNKGMIRQGYDADIVLIDQNIEKAVKKEGLFTKSGWSPFEGMSLVGWPVMTIINGNVVFDHGKINDGSTGKEVRFD
jgi:dihydroorotase